MNITVIVRQVPDLIEPVEIAASGTALDLSAATFIVNESDDHALEQALLLKEAHGGAVTVVAIDFGDIDNTLYAAAAKGADRIVKIAWQEDSPPAPQAAAARYAEVIREIQPDLVLVGIQAHDELDGVLAPRVAAELNLPYVGVIRGVKDAGGGVVSVCKEFPGAVMSRMKVRLPAVLGILGAEQPPRYVPVSRVRAAMKSVQFDQRDCTALETDTGVEIERFYFPEAAGRAEMFEGSAEEVAERIAVSLAEKGLLK
ncbi:MAG: electron transfer flavoprotein subunit beta/FixA family protein [Pirellulales bacterium]